MSSLRSYDCDFSEGHASVTTTEERNSIGLPEVDPDFINKFFVPLEETLPDITVDDDGPVSQLLGNIYSATTESAIYADLATLFNKIAEALSTNIAPSNQPLYFKNSPEIAPAGKSHRQTRSITPDILVLPPMAIADTFLHGEDVNDSSSNKSRYPWHIVESVVEVKMRKEWNHSQALDYLETILQQRPDKTNVLGMSANQFEYQFYYIDACTQKSSVTFQWESGLKEVAHFIYSLHRIYHESINRDNSMSLHNLRWDNDYAHVLWDIQAEGKNYEVQSVFERKGPGRRTWLGVGKQLDASSLGDASYRGGNVEPAICVVKDMWRDNSRRYVEGDLLKHIHDNGIVPGVVRPIMAKSLNDLTLGRRTKHRLIMGSTGLRLSACRSVLEFLKVMYDVVETHEKVMERGVLHRDISWYNVLCNPKHYKGGDDNVVANQPNISKILGEANADPLCLLTDFDNAGLLEDEQNPDGLTERTGTPMFMAAELAYGTVIRTFTKGTSLTLHQLLLEGEARQRYIKSYGEERYEKFNAFITSIPTATSVESRSELADSSVIHHRPHHDIESVYWIIVWFLLKAWPVGTDSNGGIPNQAEYKYVIDTLLARRFGGPFMYVAMLLSAERSLWMIVLPSPCHSLAQMLADMGQYLCMRWSSHSDIPHWHAHEAFKRLLLKEIWRMSNEDEPIPIQGPLPWLSKNLLSNLSSKDSGAVATTSSRNTTAKSSLRHSTTSGQPQKSNKRARSDSVGTPSSGDMSKRQRTLPMRGAARECKENTLVRECIQNIEDDEKWFM